MTRNLKMLGLAVCSVLALTAFAASAQAANFISPASTTLTVTPDGSGTTAHQVFDAAGASITCPNVSGQAATGGTVATITATSIKYPASGECKFVGQTATVNMNGCDYNFSAANPGTPGTNAGIKVECPGGGSIKFSVPSPLCEVSVPAQSLSGVTYHNINANTEVTVEAHVTGITYTATGAGCPTAGEQSNGNYTTGNFIVTGENAGGSMVAVKVE